MEHGEEVKKKRKWESVKERKINGRQSKGDAIYICVCT